MKKAWEFGLILALAVILSGCGKNTDDAVEAISGIFDQVEAGLDSLEEQLDDLDGAADPEPAETTAPTEGPETTAEPQQEATPTEDAPSDDTIRPEIKQAIDDYEAFFAQYAEFMAKYSASDNSLGMMSDYLSMVKQYAESTEGFDEMEDMDLTTAELKYYTEASLRISQSLLSVVG